MLFRVFRTFPKQRVLTKVTIVSLHHHKSCNRGLIGEGHTCFPAPKLRKKMKAPVDDDVVVKDNIVTSKGPGTAIKFAIKLGELLYSEEKAKAIAAEMLVEM